jgi:hypothetical protein
VLVAALLRALMTQIMVSPDISFVVNAQGNSLPYWPIEMKYRCHVIAINQ